MPLQFHPTIRRDSLLFPLPRPVVSLRVQDTWDSERFKFPLIDGDRTVGHSQGGTTLSLQGQVGAHAGEVRLAEADMLATLLALRDVLHVGGTQPPFDFVLFIDPETDAQHLFRTCSTTRFDWDLSDANLFTYTLTLHADDPRVHVV
jgi:hypothetical protein